MTNPGNVEIHVRGDVSGLKQAIEESKRTLDDLKQDVVSRAGEMSGASSNLTSVLSRLPAAQLAVAASTMVMAKAYLDGVREIEAMNIALGKSGNISGQSVAGLHALAVELADDSRLTISQAKEVTTALAASGQVGAAAFRNITLLAGDFARVMGTDVAAVAPELAKLFSDPAKGAEELNKSMHFLSGAELAHIEHLARMGEVTAAQNELAGKLRERLDEIAPALNRVDAAFDRVKKTAAGAWDAMMGLMVGGKDTKSQLDALYARIKDVEAMGSTAKNLPTDKQLPALYQQALQLEERLAKESGQRLADSAHAEQNRNEQTLKALRERLLLSEKIKVIDDQIAMARKTGNQDDLITALERQKAKLFEVRQGKTSSGKPAPALMDENDVLFNIDEAAEKLKRQGWNETERALDSLTEKYRQIADPLKKFKDELIEIEKLRGIPGGLTDGEADAAMARVNGQMQDTIDKMAGVKDIGKELGLTFSSAFEDAIVGGRNFSDVLKGLEQDILRLVVRKSITEPMAEGISGMVKSSGIGDFFGSFLKSVVPSFAVGTPYVPQDTLAFIHRGERILTADENRAGSGGGVSVTIIEDASRGGQQQQSVDSSGNRQFTLWIAQLKNDVKTEIASDISSGSGIVPNAISSRFGLSAVPY